MTALVTEIIWLLKAMEAQLKETQKLADMYREQVIELEDKLARIREEGDVGKELFKVRTVCCSFFLYIQYTTPLVHVFAVCTHKVAV